MLKTNEWIITTNDLRNDTSTILKNAKQRPLVVTEEGRPAAYVVSVEMFDSLFERMLRLEQEDLATQIAEGERNFAEGNFVTLAEALRSAEAKWQTQESANE